jgi:DNA excision repair protein ERCC-3
LRPWDGIKLRSYQEYAWNEFLNKGAIGVFWAFGSGKSLFGIYALARVKGRKLVVVPTLTLKEQWLERINQYIPQYRHEVEVVTYHAYDKVKSNEYSLVCYDEVQHLPANTFIRLATLKAKYRMGFSGSPYREDGRENYIIALTGFPIGMSWEELIKLQVVRKPVFRVYILKDNRDKMRKLGELLRIPVKTIIFCDWLDFGERIAKTFNIPFVYGETKDRLEVIRQSQGLRRQPRRGRGLKHPRRGTRHRSGVSLWFQDAGEPKVRPTYALSQGGARTHRSDDRGGV